MTATAWRTSAVGGKEWSEGSEQRRLRTGRVVMERWAGKRVKRKREKELDARRERRKEE